MSYNFHTIFCIYVYICICSVPFSVSEGISRLSIFGVKVYFKNILFLKYFNWNEFLNVTIDTQIRPEKRFYEQNLIEFESYKYWRSNILFEFIYL